MDAGAGVHGAVVEGGVKPGLETSKRLLLGRARAAMARAMPAVYAGAVERCRHVFHRLT